MGKCHFETIQDREFVDGLAIQPHCRQTGLCPSFYTRPSSLDNRLDDVAHAQFMYRATKQGPSAGAKGPVLIHKCWTSRPRRVVSGAGAGACVYEGTAAARPAKTVNLVESA
jgi:hypothetical protein